MNWYQVTYAFLLSLVIGAVAPTDAAAQCEGCDQSENSHSFPGGLECGGTFCEESWFECGSECHTSSSWGTCESHHVQCFMDDEDSEALAAALQTGVQGTLTPTLLSLMVEGRLTYVPDRSVLLVRGCHGSYVAAFPVSSVAAPAVREAVSVAAIDR